MVRWARVRELRDSVAVTTEKGEIRGMEKFKIGEVVRTKEGGGPQMCVVGYKGKLVKCRWWDGKKSVTEAFDSATISVDNVLAGVPDRILKQAAHLVREVPRSKRRTE